MTPTSFAYSGIMTGCNIALAHLIREMDSKSLISKDQYASQIENAIVGLPLKEKGMVRYDRVMLADLVKLLRDPQTGWNPQVIQGGLSDPTDPESSDP